jgi:6-pyruvoyltetrahydropterin/6-carboxytetrahydropterin synthase
VFILSIRDGFSAAHRIQGKAGPCEELHGHNFAVEVSFGGQRLDSRGLLVDFRVLKGYVRAVLSRLDHRYLNEIPYFRERASSSEYIALYIFEEMERLVQNEGVNVLEVKVWESENSCASYRREA